MSSNLGLLVFESNAVFTIPGLAAPFLDIKQTGGETGYRFFVSSTDLVVANPDG